MKTTLSFLLIGVLAFVFASCDKEAPIGVVNTNDNVSPPAKAQGKQVPFKVRVTFSFVEMLPPDATRCGEDAPVYVWQGSGYGTHLGKFDVALSNCSLDEGAAFKNGEGFYIAANGDRIDFVYSKDVVTLLVPTDDPDVFTFENPWEFTGGTGRFAGVSGSGVTYGYYNAAEFAGGYVNVGTISTVGSGKGK